MRSLLAVDRPARLRRKVFHRSADASRADAAHAAVAKDGASCSRVARSFDHVLPGKGSCPSPSKRGCPVAKALCLRRGAGLDRREGRSMVGAELACIGCGVTSLTGSVDGPDSETPQDTLL